MLRLALVWYRQCIKRFAAGIVGCGEALLPQRVFESSHDFLAYPHGLLQVLRATLSPEYACALLHKAWDANGPASSFRSGHRESVHDP